MKIIKSRIFKILIALFIFGIVLGIISFIISKDNSSLYNYFTILKEGNFNYLNGLISSISYNYKYAFFIWIIGIVFFISFISLFIIVFRGICLGFSICSIFYTFKIKGLLYSLILLFPCTIVNEIVYLLLSFYSINFSIKVFNAIKKNKFINIRSFTKNYLYILLIFLTVLFISSLFEVYISSNILKNVI